MKIPDEIWWEGEQWDSLNQLAEVKGYTYDEAFYRIVRSDATCEEEFKSRKRSQEVLWLHAGDDEPTLYKSITIAARALGCAFPTMTRRLRLGQTGDHDLQPPTKLLHGIHFRGAVYEDYYEAAVAYADERPRVTYDYIRKNSQIIPAPEDEAVEKVKTDVVLPVLVRRWQVGDLPRETLIEILDYNGMTWSDFQNAMKKGGE